MMIKQSETVRVLELVHVKLSRDNCGNQKIQGPGFHNLHVTQKRMFQNFLSVVHKLLLDLYYLDSVKRKMNLDYSKVDGHISENITKQGQAWRGTRSLLYGKQYLEKSKNDINSMF